MTFAKASSKGLFSATEPAEDKLDSMGLLSLAGMTGSAVSCALPCVTLSPLWSRLNPNIECSCTPRQLLNRRRYSLSPNLCILHWQLEFSIGLSILLNYIHKEPALPQSDHSQDQGEAMKGLAVA